ncbi:hypothetical protein ABK905_11070 [Acerihabitans sp. KWT182]|uniref:Tox-PLDMTX domain-containing protein n=1 Tax=Acerihabitans sp. KWT182 TaxID=3157919 RepID=A0AAU7QED1_9GAMM
MVNLPTLCYAGLKKNIQFVNSRSKAQTLFQKNLRKEWSTNISPDKLKPLWDGIYTENALGTEIRHFIKDRNQIFQVQRDGVEEVWRVIDPNKGDSLDTAIAVVPQGADRWEINPVDLGIESAVLLDQVSTLSTKSVIPDIQFENTASVHMPLPDEGFHSEQHKKILDFFLTENTYFMNEMSSSHFDKNDILLALADRLSGKASKDDVFSRGGYTTLQNLMIHEFYSLSAKFQTSIRYRAINFWIDKIDNNPVNHLLLSYTVGENSYIIDLQIIRPSKNINDSNTQVYLEQEWLQKYKNEVTAEFTLVKYKDYNNIHDALLFSQNGNLSPSRIIEDTYLLREPAWYQRSVLHNSQNTLKFKYPILSMHSPTFRVICRKTIRKLYGKTPFVALPPKILQEARFIDEAQADALLHHLTVSSSNTLSAGAFLDAGSIVPSVEILNRINQGKLVLFYDQRGLLKHAQISLGNGRFASAENSFLIPAYLITRPF